MTATLDRFVYQAAQGARFFWFFGQKLLAARLSEAMPAPAHLKGRMPSTERLLRDLGALLRRDWENIEAGRYALPANLADNPLEALEKARLFFIDLKAVNERRQSGRNSEVMAARPPARIPPHSLHHF